jgi:hypothetical protein
MKLREGDVLQLCRFVVFLNFWKVASQKAKNGGNFEYLLCMLLSIICLLYGFFLIKNGCLMDG